MIVDRTSDLTLSEMDAFFAQSLKKIETSRKTRKASTSLRPKALKSIVEKRKVQKIEEYRIRQDIYNNNFSSISALFKKIISIGCVDEGTPV